MTHPATFPEHPTESLAKWCHSGMMSTFAALARVMTSLVLGLQFDTRFWADSTRRRAHLDWEIPQ